MKVLVAGHLYQVSNFEKSTDEKGQADQKIQFIQKGFGKKTKTAKLETIANGTTSEEILEVLIDRTKYFMSNSFAKFPGNDVILEKLQECLKILNDRTRLRINDGIEGTKLANKIIQL